MTKKIFVNEIVEEDNGSRTGIIAWNETIIEAMQILYNDKLRNNLSYLVIHPPHADGFHMFSRFCQLIVLFQFDNKLGAKHGISIKLTDFQNNLDNALDEYLKLAEKQWDLEDRNTIMKISEEIRNDQSNDKAEMIIKFHIRA